MDCTEKQTVLYYQIMRHSQKPDPLNISFWKNPKSWLYHQWAGIYSFLMENFNPKWREPLPLVPCQICGKPGHNSKDCPSAKEMGFWDLFWLQKLRHKVGAFFSETTSFFNHYLEPNSASFRFSNSVLSPYKTVTSGSTFVLKSLPFCYTL